MKTLLAIIYEPSEADNFITYALAVAGRFKWKLVLVYVQSYETNPPPGLSAGLAGNYAYTLDKDFEEDKKKAEQALSDQLKEIFRQTKTKVQPELFVEYGNAKAVIQEYMEKYEGCMVILEGKHKGSLMSLNASNIDVVKHVDCPVWIIPTDLTFVDFDRIAYASDFDESDIPTLNRLVELMKGMKPQVAAFHIAEEMDFEQELKKLGLQEMIKHSVDYDKVSVQLVENNKESTGDAICHFADDEKARLIVLLKGSQGFFEGLLNPSATKKVLHQAHLPVLIFHKH